MGQRHHTSHKPLFIININITSKTYEKYSRKSYCVQRDSRITDSPVGGNSPFIQGSKSKFNLCYCKKPVDEVDRCRLNLNKPRQINAHHTNRTNFTPNKPSIQFVLNVFASRRRKRYNVKSGLNGAVKSRIKIQKSREFRSMTL
jgi:hypothetical protein